MMHRKPVYLSRNIAPENYDLADIVYELSTVEEHFSSMTPRERVKWFYNIHRLIRLAKHYEGRTA